MSDTVTVIVPVYNVERYLNKCVESICAQTYRELEIIIIDDGSTDTSGERCDRWASADDRVRVIHQKNGGLSAARNAGLEVACGDWLMFVDSDDSIAADTVERLLKSARENNCDISVCNIIRVFNDGSTEPFYRPATECELLDGERRFETLLQPSVCNKLFRAELFDTVRFPVGKYYEDTYVYHRLVFRAARLALSGHDGYYYLMRHGSILGGEMYTDRYFDMIEAVYLRMTFLFENGVEHYGRQAAMSMYAAVANAEKNIKKTSQNADKIRMMRRQYREAYEHLDGVDVGIKQRLRIFLLRYVPRLHTVIY